MRLDKVLGGEGVLAVVTMCGGGMVPGPAGNPPGWLEIVY